MRYAMCIRILVPAVAAVAALLVGGTPAQAGGSGPTPQDCVVDLSPGATACPTAQAVSGQDGARAIADRVLNSSDPAETYKYLSSEDKRLFDDTMLLSTTQVTATALGQGSIAGQRLSGEEAEKLIEAANGFAPVATSNNGVCETGEFCYYYNSNSGGSLRDFSSSSLSTYYSDTGACYTFKSAGSGQGVCVKNNAASVWNRMSSAETVYYNSNYGGASQSFASDAKGNLNATLKNNNASHRPSTTSACWSVTATGNGKSAVGTTLYTYGQSTEVCVSSGRVTSVSLFNVWNETSTPGWRIDKAPTTTTYNAGWEGRGLANYYFVLGSGGWDVQKPTTCLQVRANADFVHYSASYSCSLS